MTDGRKLIETDDKKSNGAKNEGWNIMLKGRGQNELDHICFYDDPGIPTLHCTLQTAGQKVAYLEYHQEQFCDWFSKTVVGGGTELT